MKFQILVGVAVFLSIGSYSWNAESATPSRATTRVSLSFNLDARAEPMDYFDGTSFETAGETSSTGINLNVYDSSGNERPISIFFNKIDENIWAYHALILGNQLVSGGSLTGTTTVALSEGRLEFSKSGQLENVLVQNRISSSSHPGLSMGKPIFSNLGIDWSDESQTVNPIVFDFGQVRGSKAVVTQFPKNEDKEYPDEEPIGVEVDGGPATSAPSR